MKYILLIFISSIIFYSCKSPAEVDAARERNLISIEPSDDATGINSDFNEVDFGLVFRDSAKKEAISIKLINNSDKKLMISGCYLSKESSSFSFDSSIFPLVLQPQGTDNSTCLLKLYYNPDKTGFFLDTLKFNNFKDISIRLKATTPSIFVQELEFKDTYISYSNEANIRIYNFGDKLAHIKGIKDFDDADSVFFINSSQFPLSINPRAYTDVKVKFSPRENKTYIAQIEFDIFSADKGPALNYCIVKGKGNYK